MGRSYQCFTQPACTPEELRKIVGNLQEEARSEYGYDPYSGSIATCHGLSIESTLFETENEAYEYVMNKADKRDILAVKVKVHPPLNEKEQGQRDELYKKANELNGRVQNYTRQIILPRLVAGKSKTKGCSKCGSQIAVEYMVKGWSYMTDCPVCRHDFLTTETDHKKKNALKVQLDKALKALNDWDAKRRSKIKTTDWAWCVGYWAAE